MWLSLVERYVRVQIADSCSAIFQTAENPLVFAIIPHKKKKRTFGALCLCRSLCLRTSAIIMTVFICYRQTMAEGEIIEIPYVGSKPTALTTMLTLFMDGNRSADGVISRLSSSVFKQSSHGLHRHERSRKHEQFSLQTNFTTFWENCQHLFYSLTYSSVSTYKMLKTGIVYFIFPLSPIKVKRSP